MRLSIFINIIIPFVSSDTTVMWLRRAARSGRGRIVVAFVLESSRVSQGLALRVRTASRRAFPLGCAFHTLVSWYWYAAASPLVRRPRLFALWHRSFLVEIKVYTLATSKATHEPASTEVFWVDHTSTS
jgi:hypothetical protein